MNLSMIEGFISGFCFVESIFMLKKNKKLGAIILVLTIIAPVALSLFCAQKYRFVFGGTDWEFLVQTATIDGLIEPWLILLLYIALITVTLYSLLKYRKK